MRKTLQELETFTLKNYCLEITMYIFPIPKFYNVPNRPVLLYQKYSNMKSSAVSFKSMVLNNRNM